MGLTKMDKCMRRALLTGSEEAFSQMMHLIMGEVVPPDYQHCETWATPLMIASRQGRVDIVKQLLAVGASLMLRSRNGWTAADYAKATGQQKILDLLHIYSITTAPITQPLPTVPRAPEQPTISCLVCMDPLGTIQKSPRLLCSTVCGHVFCSTCIETVITQRHQCPVCRKRLTKSQYHPLFI